MWLEFDSSPVPYVGFRFAFGCCPAPRGFLLFLKFSCLHEKKTSPNFNSIGIEDLNESQLINVDLAFSICIVIYLFIIPWQNAQSLTSYMSCKCFSGVSCQTIPNPKNGVATKLINLLQLRCNQGYFFNPYPAGLPGLFQNPSYRCIDNKWVSQNDLVSILHKAPDCMSKSFV